MICFSLLQKLVSNIIKKIRRTEEKLIAAGIELAERINDDGTFTVLSVNKDTIPVEATTTISTEENTDNMIEAKETTLENTTSAIKKTKNSKKIVPTKKLREDDASSTPKNVKLGVTVKESIKTKINVLADDNNMKVNDVVIDLLEKVFDGEKFNVEFEKNEQTKITSFNIPQAMDKALIKLNKATGIPKTELFNKLLEEALREFFE